MSGGTADLSSSAATPTRQRDRAALSHRSTRPTASASIAATPPRPTAASASLATASPHYTTALRSRHSLYGTEDRVVLDLGSNVWKIGFSSEPSPRYCTSVSALLSSLPGSTTQDSTLWDFDEQSMTEEDWQVVYERTRRCLRHVWHEYVPPWCTKC